MPYIGQHRSSGGRHRKSDEPAQTAQHRGRGRGKNRAYVGDHGKTEAHLKKRGARDQREQESKWAQFMKWLRDDAT